jgi:hypothetical protein
MLSPSRALLLPCFLCSLAKHLASKQPDSPLSRAAFVSARRTTPGCAGVVPERTVLLTYTNVHHFPLLALHVCLREGSLRVCSLAKTQSLSRSASWAQKRV